MAYYRILRDLSKGNKIVKTGQITSLAGLPQATVDKLEKVGAIAEVSPPPLSELPGWQTRAVKLADTGIITATQFLELKDYEIVKKLFRVKDETVEAWKKQITDIWLAPPPQKRGG
jgi:hypothetical protein